MAAPPATWPMSTRRLGTWRARLLRSRPASKLAESSPINAPCLAGVAAAAWRRQVMTPPRSTRSSSTRCASSACEAPSCGASASTASTRTTTSMWRSTARCSKRSTAPPRHATSAGSSRASCRRSAAWARRSTRCARRTRRWRFEDHSTARWSSPRRSTWGGAPTPACCSCPSMPAACTSSTMSSRRTLSRSQGEGARLSGWSRGPTATSR
mmetsp:Transcript_6802/g.15778  ORF Transcript_6802/g.15778 Transcript_6802/m.15778 type:complete len:211 (+) Transcript_6802:1107-1739(+)